MERTQIIMSEDGTNTILHEQRSRLLAPSFNAEKREFCSRFAYEIFYDMNKSKPKAKRHTMAVFTLTRISRSITEGYGTHNLHQNVHSFQSLSFTLIYD